MGEQSETKAKILVIDDEKAIRITMKRILEKVNYYVETAGSYQSAKNNIENLDFDLILVDLVLPKVNGIDIIKHFNEDYGLDVPVIFLTGEPNFNSAVEALRIGAFDYIEKPIQKSQLLKVIDYALSRKKLEKEGLSKNLKSEIEVKLKDFRQNVQIKLIQHLGNIAADLRTCLNVLNKEGLDKISNKYKNTMKEMDETISELEIAIKKSQQAVQVIESIFNL
ncbi:MAG: response regulator [Promethearchaeota archaeon]